MKILMLVNWKIEYCDRIPVDKQPPDYYVKGIPYWFFRYFEEKPEVDVVDVSSFSWLEKFEKNKLRFYIWQTLRVLPRLRKYDLIVSHGMQSGILLSLIRRFFNTKAKHIVFDIGSFNSAAESGVAHRLMQFASKSIDGIIYHTRSQIDYYKKCFPWIVEKSKYIRFGADIEFFCSEELEYNNEKGSYIVCVGVSKLDKDTLVKAYKRIKTNIKLRLIGHVDPKYQEIPGIEQLPYIPVNELINHIYNSLFCVLPFEYHNRSYGQMRLLHQMALGKAVIAAKVPSLVDYAEDGKTALFYEAQNVEMLAECIKKLLDEPDLADTIGRNAKGFLINACNESVMALDIEKEFKHVVGS